MNKAQLIEKLTQKTNEETTMTKAQAEIALDAALEIILTAVSKGEEVKLVGFGTFVRSKRKARKGRNPQTGETYHLPAAFVPRFRVGKEFRTRVNK